MKAQTTLEFIGSAVFFILVLIATVTLIAGELPRFYEGAETTEKNLEAKYMTDHLLNSNTSTEPGLVNEYMEVDKQYLKDDFGTIGSSNYNRTQLTQDLGLDFEYNIRFTWYPVIETHKTFVRGNSPSYIIEPTGDPRYDNAGNIVHYGNITLEGNEERFLITSVDGEYEDVYYDSSDVPNDNWNFLTDPDQVGDYINTSNAGNFTIRGIQNRPETPGAALILGRPIEFADGRKYFGYAEETAEGEIIKLSRYPVLEGPSTRELSKMEVLIW